ncbi:short-chain dehydrogenase [Pandoraea captiosa]|uniref:Short-chain dehydrogenase n=1 Tax=Pandoraea captiosa TaxID=2508302 RepID=A0A5E5ALS7_9BURK|nr:SDR family NAD(P)-dependent oxidoreductase [Pandoraea captiosa]VVE73525.1 short-chain dehydrogenase [Pandoraea captiosa]
MQPEGARHIVITGASAGLGRALAHTYARPGTVLGLCGRDATRLRECAFECEALGAKAVVATLDVRDAAAMSSWIDDFDAHWPIDMLIANAGAASTLSNASDWEDSHRVRSIVDVNLYGTINSVLPALTHMRERKHGRIVLISSIAALRGMAISPAYCASKSAIKAWGDSLRPMLARDGIALSVVLPGFVKTAMSDVFPGDKPMMRSAPSAAALIARKVAAGRAEIAFPTLLALGMRLLALLPVAIADRILDRLSYLPKAEA